KKGGKKAVAKAGGKQAGKAPKKTKPAVAKATKAIKTSSNGSGGKPGVVDAVVSILGKASPDKSVTKKDVLDKLEKMFPDRRRESMWNTVSSQIPNRILRERGVKVEGDNK